MSQSPHSFVLLSNQNPLPIPFLKHPIFSNPQIQIPNSQEIPSKATNEKKERKLERGKSNNKIDKRNAERNGDENKESITDNDEEKKMIYIYQHPETKNKHFYSRVKGFSIF